MAGQQEDQIHEKTPDGPVQTLAWVRARSLSKVC